MSLKLNRKQQRGPFGGHHFFSGGKMFRGDTFDKLKDSLSQFRVDNGIPVGDPEQDILGYYASKFPWLVLPDEKVSEDKDENYTRWRDWISSTWRRAPTKFVTIKQARERWAVCATCPMNLAKNWPESDESASFTKRAFTLRRGVTVPSDLGFCTCHKADLGVFTFLEATKDYSNQNGPQPSNCWVGSLAGL